MRALVIPCAVRLDVDSMTVEANGPVSSGKASIGIEIRDGPTSATHYLDAKGARELLAYLAVWLHGGEP